LVVGQLAEAGAERISHVPGQHPPGLEQVERAAAAKPGRRVGRQVAAEPRSDRTAVGQILRRLLLGQGLQFGRAQLGQPGVGPVRGAGERVRGQAEQLGIGRLLRFRPQPIRLAG
jgi:hypothetical protein